MNLLPLAATLVTLASSAFAQLLPPSSASDGVFTEAAGPNHAPTRWTSPAGLGAYRAGAAPGFFIPATGTPDNALGLLWGAGRPSTAALNAHGGLARLIFIQGAKEATGAAGYSYSGDPLDFGTTPGQGAFTLWNSLSDGLSFGDHAVLRLEAGEFDSFDFWLGADDGTLVPLFGGAPVSLATRQVSWTQAPLTVRTFLGVDANQRWKFGPLDTHLVALHDAEGDVDALFALQLVPAAGGPLGAVPEPATYGVFAVAGIAGVLVWRRRRVLPARE